MTFATSQVLDIDTMQFEPGPTMQEARFLANTALDADRVIVIGGRVNGAESASTEVLSVAGEL